jgi:SAM-dependent methyltransferase
VREENLGFVLSLRDERMQKVSQYSAGFILDLGCGPGNIFVQKYSGGNGVGADVFSYEGIDVLVSSSTLPFRSGRFDTVSLIAVGGHIPKRLRDATFKEIHRVLRPGGRLVMTEGELLTQTVHHKIQFFFDRFRQQKNMDTVRGMDEEEEFAMPHEEIQGYLKDVFGNFERHRFQWGLNNVYLANKSKTR